MPEGHNVEFAISASSIRRHFWLAHSKFYNSATSADVLVITNGIYLRETVFLWSELEICLFSYSLLTLFLVNLVYLLSYSCVDLITSPALNFVIGPILISLQLRCNLVCYFSQ